MTTLLEARIQALNATTLTPIVLQALDCPDGWLADWTAEPLRPASGNWGPSVIYRFSGTARNRDQTVPWSLILKVSSGALERVGSRRKDDEPLQREATFYGSEIVYDFPSGFRPARCYALYEQLDQSGQTEYWVWLEDLSTRGRQGQTMDDRYQMAYGLGLCHGAFIDHPALSDATWLKREQIRTYMEGAAPQFKTLADNRLPPLARRAFPAECVDSLLSMWQCRDAHLRTLTKLPQTLCHGDAQETNLFLVINEAGKSETVAIDWTGVGVGPIGMDATQLFAGSVVYMNLRADKIAALSQGLYANYLAGMQAAGWSGDPRVVRLGYTASMIRARTAVVNRVLQIFTDDTVRQHFARSLQARGVTLEDLADTTCELERFLRGLFEESLVLRGQLLF